MASKKAICSQGASFRSILQTAEAPSSCPFPPSLWSDTCRLWCTDPCWIWGTSSAIGAAAPWDSWVLTDKQWCWYLNPRHHHKPFITLALSYAPSLLLSLLNPWQLEAAWWMLMLSFYNRGHMFGFMLLCCLRCSGQLLNAVPGWWSTFQALLPCQLHVAKNLFCVFLCLLLSIYHCRGISVFHWSAAGFLLFKLGA